MTKIFDLDFRKGTLIDSVSKIKGTLSAGTGGFKKTEKGLVMEFDGDATRIDITSNTYDVDGSTVSFEFWARRTSLGAYVAVIGRTGVNDYSWIAFNTSNNLTIESDTNNNEATGTVLKKDTNWHHYLVCCDNGAVTMYQDNIELSTTGTLTNDITLSIIGSVHVEKYFPGQIAKYCVHNTALTQNERNALYEEFLHSYGSVEQKRNFTYPKSTDLSSEVDSVVEENLIPEDSSSFETDGTAWWAAAGVKTWNSSTKDMTVTNSSTSDCVIYKNDSALFPLGQKMLMTFQAKSDTISDTMDPDNAAGSKWIPIKNPTLTSEYQLYIFEYTQAATTYTAIRTKFDHSAGKAVTYDNITIQKITGLVAAYNMIPSKGTLVDISGNGNNGTINGASSTKDGMAFDGVDDNVTFNIDNSLTSWSIQFRGTLKDLSNYNTIFSNDVNGGFTELTLSGWYTLKTYSSSGGTSFTLSDSLEADRKYTIVVTYDASSGIGRSIINGNVTYSGTSNFGTISSGNGYIGSYRNSSQYGELECEDFRLQNYAMTIQQAKDYHNSFNKPTLRETFDGNGADGVVKTPRGWTKGTGDYKTEELAIEEGDIVGGWDFTSGWTTVGTVSNITSNSFQSTGSSGLRILGKTTFGKRYRVKISATISAGTLTLREYGGANQIILTGTGSFEETAEYTALGSSTGFFFRTDESSNVTITNFEVIEITPLPNFGTGTKYLECDSAGTMVTQSKQAYGEWEFDLYKGADGNYVNIHFIQNNQNLDDGYALLLWNNESVILERIDGGSFTTDLFATGAYYISNNIWYRTKVARLKSEGVFKDIPTLQTSAMVNSNYTTFTSNGRYGFSATSDGSGYYEAGTADEISIVDTKKYLVEFDLKLNSGTAPISLLKLGLRNSGISNTITTIVGRNSHILTATSTTTGVLAFINSSITSDYEISGLQIRQIYPAHTFATFIKGGVYGDTETGWTLVDPASGSNPVTDSTYKTSEYLVLDLDDGDRVTNIITKSEVEQ